MSSNTDTAVFPYVLSFAPSDPTGGSGIQGDLLTFASMGCHGLSVVTAVTVQDSVSVEDWDPVDAETIDNQARCVLEDMPVAVFKVGMLADVEAVSNVAEILADYPDVPVVLELSPAIGPMTEIDQDDLDSASAELLIPQASIVVVSSSDIVRYVQENQIEDEDEPSDAGTAISPGHEMPPSDTLPLTLNPATRFIEAADHAVQPIHGHTLLYAQALLAKGAEYVLLTGVENHTLQIMNTLIGQEGIVRTDTWQRLPGNFRGASATLTAAIAALIANGMEMSEAVREAQDYTWQSLSSAFRGGMGRQFPDRFFWTRTDRVESIPLNE